MVNKVKMLRIKLEVLWKKGAFHILVGGFFGKFVALFGSIIIVRFLSKEEYGLLSYIENFYSYAYVLAGMGLSNSILRYVVLAKKNTQKKAYYQYALKNGFKFNIALIIVIAILNLFYPHATEFLSAKYLLIIMLISLPFQHLTDDAIYMERAMFSNNRFTYFSIMITFFVLIGRVLGAVGGGLTTIIIIQGIVYIVLAISLIYSVNRKHLNKDSEGIYEIQSYEKKQINVYSIQYMITNGFWTIFMLNDVFMIGQFCNDPTILADYRVAYVLPGCLSILSSAIGTFVSPYFVQKEADKDWVRKSYWKVFFCTIGIVGIASLIISLFAKYIISFVYGSDYLNIIPLMNLLLISSFINCGFRFTSANLLAAMGAVKYNMYVSFFGIVLQIILNLIFIPKFAAIGAAYTSIISYFLMGLVLMIVFSRKYNLFKKVRRNN